MSAFYIASLKHTNKDHEHITFWATFHRGYTPVFGSRVGRYCYGEAVSLNDGESYIAVPTEAVDAMLQPEPYFRTHKGESAKFYDQHGPVLDNTRANWNALIKASLQTGRRVVAVKPEVFRGPRRSFALIAAPIAPALEALTEILAESTYDDYPNTPEHKSLERGRAVLAKFAKAEGKAS